MKKEALLEALMPGPYGINYGDPSVLHNSNKILHLVQQDHGLSSNKKKDLTAILNSPEAFDHILSGVVGMAVGRAIAHYSSMSKPARTLLSLAGFGIGNIIYNTLQDNKFSTYDKKTGISTLR